MFFFMSKGHVNEKQGAEVTESWEEIEAVGLWSLYQPN